MRATMTSKYDHSKPKLVREFDLLGLNGMREKVALFEAGELSAELLAKAIIQALFEKEFYGGPRWSVGSPSAEARGENIFYCEMEADYSHKDIDSVASSKGTITIRPDSIHIEEYSYYVAG
mmetsp:Transcript_5538/g.14155  ORF Transcript_5538/g.14155 Transcript_5538/m.14155 type:complete len:121 (-) Transcript_5538:212-574(-)